MVHIESRKSKRTNSEYEIFVSLEKENGNVQVPKLVKSLKKQLSYVRFESDYESKLSTESKESSICENEESDVFDTSNSAVINSDGILVRKSNI